LEQRLAADPATLRAHIGEAKLHQPRRLSTKRYLLRLKNLGWLDSAQNFKPWLAPDGSSLITTWRDSIPPTWLHTALAQREPSFGSQLLRCLIHRQGAQKTSALPQWEPEDIRALLAKPQAELKAILDAVTAEVPIAELTKAYPALRP
jgi:hypothetical protein